MMRHRKYKATMVHSTISVPSPISYDNKITAQDMEPIRDDVVDECQYMTIN